MTKKLIGAILLSVAPVLALADGDADKGKKVFKKCKACHMVGEGAENKTGPVLNGVVGRQIASVEGYKYSDALAALGAEEKTWTPEELSAFLEKPRSYAKGTIMSFGGLRKEKDRDNLIAYLALQGEAPEEEESN